MRWIWMTITAVCLLTAISVGLAGYTGYSIVIGAVSISAAINIPSE